MLTQDQRDVVEFLASSATHGGAPVERIETHASVVFLAGDRAWKLKRAVKYDYLDFSTAERRRAMCDAELRINRRTAPELYLGVSAITRQADGSLALGGSGEAVDWVIEMVRFDQDDLLDRQAARGTLDLAMMRPLAASIARFHARAARRADHGGRRGMQWVVDGNAAGFLEQGAGILDRTVADALTGLARAALQRHERLLDARRDAGFVRQCHGDLHLRNIVLIDGRPTLFDGVEFNDEIACLDVLYDLAFLLMDLWRRHLPGHANVVWNGYVQATNDVGGVPLMPLFLSCRAAVRAKTSATAATLQSEAARQRELQHAARTYLTMAWELLNPPAPCLIAVGGFSGSGKSTLAARLAPRVGAVPGALVIRSDEVRKRLHGVEAQRPLGVDAYREEVTQRVYDTLIERATAVVRSGHAAIVDAVFARIDDRRRAERAAAAANVPFVGLWLDAAPPVLIARVEARRGDASDADVTVVEQQLATDTGPIGWHRIEASGRVEQVLDVAARVLGDHLDRGVVRLDRDETANARAGGNSATT